MIKRKAGERKDIQNADTSGSNLRTIILRQSSMINVWVKFWVLDFFVNTHDTIYTE